MRVAFASLLACCSQLCSGQANSPESSEQIPAFRRDQALQMLKDANDTIKKQYYDPKFHGINLDNRMKEAEKRIRESKSLSDAFGVIAWSLEALDDSHTFFIPPPRPFDIQNGWEMAFVGDNCFITAVQDGSDAAAKGLKPGDHVLAIDGFRPSRDTLWKLRYAFNVLAPRSAMHLAIASPNGQTRQLEVNSAVEHLRERLQFGDIWSLVRKQENIQQESKPRFVDIGNILIVKLPSFSIDESEADHLIGRAHDHQALILDLRGDPGGRKKH